MNKKFIVGLLFLFPLLMLAACAQPTQVEPAPDVQMPTPAQTQFPGETLASGSWMTFTTEDGLASNIVMSVIQDRQGILWIGGDEGLTLFDGKHFDIYTDAMRGENVFCSARDKQGNLWFGTGSDVAYKYNGQQWQSITPAITDLRPNVTVHDLFVDKQGDIWFAVAGNQGKRTAPMEHGATRYDGNNWATFLDRTQVRVIFQDSQGNLWFGTNVGVTCYDGSEWQTFTTEDGFADNYVVAITEDSQGNMWFGTWNDGVSCYDGKAWRTFYPDDGLETSAVHCMLKDSRGNLWFGSYSIDGYYGISRFDGTQWQHFDPWQSENDKYHYNVISIFEDKDGNIWFATSFGLVRFTPGLPDSNLGEEIKVEPAPESQISREKAIELATNMLTESVAIVVARGDVTAQLHGWYWEVTFDNVDATHNELEPFPLMGPPPGGFGCSKSTDEGIYKSVVIAIDAGTGDPVSAGAHKEPRPGPYVSRTTAINSARERITTRLPEAWLERAKVEAYLRGDVWIVLFWEDGSKDNRIKASVDAVTGEAKGFSR